MCPSAPIRPRDWPILDLLGAPISRDQHILISGFGIRGIGSVYYLMYAINHGQSTSLAKEIIALTLTMVAVSIVLHGISMTPQMNLYARGNAWCDGRRPITRCRGNRRWDTWPSQLEPCLAGRNFFEVKSR